MEIEKVNKVLKNLIEKASEDNYVSNEELKVLKFIDNTLGMILKIKETILNKNIVLIDDLIELFDLKENTKVEIPRKEFDIEEF